MYKEPDSCKYILPWVRLHCTRGYLDTLSVLEEHPETKVTFNLVPSLLMQIEEYGRREADDYFVELTLKPPTELADDEKAFLLRNFFLISYESQIKPLRRFDELYRKRGASVQHVEIGLIVNQFTEHDWMDLQAIFNLAWMGFTARKDPVIADLLCKERGFTEDDKRTIVAKQFEIAASIIPKYRAAMERGQIEISTSPFYHPILPLLINTEFAKQAMPWLTPPSFAFPQDARAQVKRAVSFMEEAIARRPVGMWPPEGAVAGEIIPYLSEEGIRWTATDQAILSQSLGREYRPSSLYYPWICRKNGASVTAFFRDTNLSDAIGFRYCKATAEDAVSNFMGELSRISGLCAPDSDEPCVTVALDGENPWEYYPDGGEDFLHRFYDAISKSDFVTSTTFSGYLDAFPATRELGELWKGSWIEHSFRIWIGGREEQTAWTYLAKAREFLESFRLAHPDYSFEVTTRAQELIFVAEASDWFWWYGDTFSSENDRIFDHLFRRYLIAVYHTLSSHSPDYLALPIKTKNRLTLDAEPVGIITPAIDGHVSHYYEWEPAGHFKSKLAGGTMARASDFIVSDVYFGFDADNLYIRIDVNDKMPVPKGSHVSIRFYSPNDSAITFPLKRGRKMSYNFYRLIEDEMFQIMQTLELLGIDEVIELSVPFSVLGVKEEENISFAVELRQAGLTYERQPIDGDIALKRPTRDYQYRNWWV
jgi:alpha-amylase/alpha-mannosidase (GH57 family)